MGRMQTEKPTRRFCHNKLAALFLAQAAPALVAMPSVSLAQESALSLEEVVVTARKREESLQDIPVSLTALSQQDIEGKGLQDMQDLVTLVPNVSFQDRGTSSSAIGIRGITTEARNIGLEDSVGMYVDGVYIGRAHFFNMDLADVQQIEVLRGPQGTLFGKNTVAGAINITTSSVADELEGKVTLSAGNHGLRRGIVQLSGPLTETLGASVAISRRRSDGYIDNLFDGRSFQGVDEKGARAKLEATPDDSLKVTAIFDWTEKRNTSSANQLGSDAGLFGASFWDQTDPYEVSKDGPTYDDQDIKGASLSADYQFESEFGLVAIASWREMNYEGGFDDDNTPGELIRSIFKDDSRQSSLELRLTSPVYDKYDYQIGVFYFDQKVRSDRNTRAFFLNDDLGGLGSVDTQSTAIYAHGNYHLTDAVTATLGVRWTRDEKEAEWTQDGIVALGNPDVTRSGEESFTEVSPTAAVTWEVDEDTTVYGKISRGFKGGGFFTDITAQATIDAGADFGFDPETVTNYEVGYKSDFLDSRLRVNTALFRMAYDDLQVAQAVAAGAAFMVTNAGEATIDGAEAEFTWLATQSLTVSGSLGYLDASYDQFRDGGGIGVHYDGNKLKNAPEWTGNLQIDYERDIGNAGTLLLSLTWSYQDETFYGASNADALLEPARDLLSAQAGFSSSDGLWTVSLWGKNLTDEEYAGYRRLLLGQEQLVPGEPRSYGIDLTLNF